MLLGEGRFGIAAGAGLHCAFGLLRLASAVVGVDLALDAHAACVLPRVDCPRSLVSIRLAPFPGTRLTHGGPKGLDRLLPRYRTARLDSPSDLRGFPDIQGRSNSRDLVSDDRNDSAALPLPKRDCRQRKKEAAMGVRSICVAICLFAASCEPAFAQAAEPNMPDKCQLAPQTDSQPTQSDQSSESPSRSLTEKLDPCDGVLNRQIPVMKRLPCRRLPPAKCQSSSRTKCRSSPRSINKTPLRPVRTHGAK